MSLYPHQEAGVEFLMSAERRYLADEMGLGKTVQAAVAAKRLGLRNVLVICPASLRANWEREWAMWGPGGGTFTAISYASTKLRTGRVVGGDWDLVILDEAHYAKNPDAGRTRQALRVAAAARRAWLLSGTPMPNHPGELYPPLAYLWPRLLEERGVHNYDQFLDRYTRWYMTDYGKRPYSAKNATELGSYISSFMLRRRVQDAGIDLPPLRVTLQYLAGGRRVDEALAAEGFDEEKVQRLVTEQDSEDAHTSRLRRLLGELKAGEVAKIVDEELRERQYTSVVVMAYHLSVLDEMERILVDWSPARVDGSTTPSARQDAVDRFNEPLNDCKVFLGQQSATGVGLNLQTSSEIILVEPAWSPDDNRQAIKRIHRIGADERPRRARVFAFAGSLDEPIMHSQMTKMNMQNEVLR